MITIIQGESYPINVTINYGGKPLTPEKVADIMICLGNVRKKYSDDTLDFNESTNKWVFYPTQDETLGIPPGFHKIWIHIKAKDGVVQKVEGAIVSIKESCCKEKI